MNQTVTADQLKKDQMREMNRVIKKAEKAWDALRDARSAFNDQKAYLQGLDAWNEWCKSRGFSLDCNFEDCGA